MSRRALVFLLASLFLALPALPLGSTPLAHGESLLSALSVPKEDVLSEALDAALYQGPQGIRPGPRPGGRPLRLYRNASVDGVVRFLNEQRREVLERGWRRSGRYEAMIRRILREEGVPEELVYLAAVESNFNPQARSPARAVGLWQFTAPTARSFGLRLHAPWYDERLDPESSTHAAARLLAYLYDRYENWELALAAYNAGEGRVNAALARARREGAPEDYWNLRLPQQTRGFVPAFLAVAAIMEAPEAHGFHPREREAPTASEGLELEIAATLTDLAARLGLPAAELAQRNPAWREGQIPPLGVGSVLLWVPPGASGRLLASLDAEPPETAPWRVHAVRKGETASHIARRYGVRTGDLLAFNGLHHRSTLSIGQSLLLPVAGAALVTDAVAATEPARQR